MANRLQRSARHRPAEERTQMPPQRAVEKRYRLQIDRLTKNSFDTFEAAEKAGAAIKKAHPVVQVAVYDAERSVAKLID